MTQQYKPLARGVWGILATPFRGANLSVDPESLERLVQLYAKAGAQGIVALGVLGEAARLDMRERRLVLRTVVGAAAGLPVVAGVATLAAAPAIEEAHAAAAAGARAVMVQVPSADPGRVTEHMHAIAEAAGLGIVVQDHPPSTGVVITPAALGQAVRDCGVAVAIKAEAPPTAPAIAELANGVAVPVFGGLGGVGLLDELLAGSAGAMTGFAVPEALVATVQAWEREGYVSARAQYAPWLPLILCEAQENISLAIRKEIFRRRGIFVEAGVRPPGICLPAAMDKALSAHLDAAPLFACDVP